MTEAEMQSIMRRDAEAEARALRARVAELERENAALRGLAPELPPRPPDGDGMPRFGLRWNGPTTPLSVPMADGYWTPWHLAQRRVAELERTEGVAAAMLDEATAMLEAERARTAAAEQRVAELEADLADADEVRTRRCNELIRDSNDYARMMEQRVAVASARAEAAEQRMAELEKALDAEKKQSAFYDLQAQRIMVQRDTAAAELNDAWKATEVAGTVRGLTTLADVVAVNRQNMKAAESRAIAAEQRAKRLEGALRAVVAADERLAREELEGAPSPSDDAIDDLTDALHDARAALAAGESQATEGGEVSHA